MNRQKLLRNIYWVAVFLATTIAVFLVSIIFLNPSSVGNPHFVRNINLWAVIWAINFVFVLVLSFILARNLIKLFFEYRTNRPGSRIKTKLVITLITFSLVPALIMSFLAFGLINQNLRQWFSAPSEQLLDSSQLIARSYYEKNRDFQGNMFEQYIQGKEITVGLIGIGSQLRTLPVLELIPQNKFYDYEAKYTEGMTQFIIPARLSETVSQTAQSVALRAHLALGCHGYSRVDMIINETEQPFVTEVNTLPGLTELSDLPAQAGAAGISYDQLIAEILAST